MRKVPNKNCYRVSNRKSKRVMAKCASKKNAEKQLRLLRAIQNNKNFVPRKSAKKGRMQKGGRTWMQYFLGYADDKNREGTPVAPTAAATPPIATGSSHSANHGVVNNTSTTA
jgi:hypothetical protein